MILNTSTNQEIRERLEKDMAVYFAKGGKITQCEYGVYGNKGNSDRGFVVNNQGSKKEKL